MDTETANNIIRLADAMHTDDSERAEHTGENFYSMTRHDWVVAMAARSVIVLAPDIVFSIAVAELVSDVYQNQTLLEKI